MSKNIKILDSDFQEKELIYIDDLTFSERLGSIFLDHTLISFTILPLCVLIEYLFFKFNIKNDPDLFPATVFVLYLNKDLVKSRSIAKRIKDQIIIDVRTNKPASPLKCAIRNFTDIFWIIEIVIILFNPNRRIGDFIAGTKVVRVNTKSKSNYFSDITLNIKINWITPILFSYVYVYLIFEFILNELITAWY